MIPGSELTPNEARKLESMLRFTEYTMRQKDLPHTSNVLDIHLKVWLTICSHTEPFMMATVYSVPGVLPPVE